MMKADVVTLIGLDPEAHEAGEAVPEIRREVYCTVRSVGQAEVYQAMGQGLNPELKIILAHDFEYEGEPLCELGGVKYHILRTYITEADGIELTIQRVRGNAAEVSTNAG
jgi:SPP1 family predicted phage head-tail adaptor